MTSFKSGLIAFSFCCVFGMSSAGSAAASTENLDQIIAIVNDDVITLTELERELEIIRNQLRSQRMPAPPLDILRKQVLEREIVKQLQLQFAASTGIRVSESDINNMVNRIAAENRLSVRELQQQIEKEGMSFAEFRKNMQHQRLIGLLQQREIHARITVTEQEIDSFLATQAVQGDANTQYLVSHILFSIPDSATPEEVNKVRKKAEAALGKLKTGEDFRQLAISSSDSSTALKDGGSLDWRRAGELPTLFAAEIYSMKKNDISSIIRSPSGFHILKLENKRSGEKHIVTQTLARHILIKPDEITPEGEVIGKLRTIAGNISRGSTSFDQAARQHSDDKGSASNGGDLGWVTPGTMVPEFEAQMNLLKPGQISDPFESTFGWHIVQVIDRKEVDDSEAYSRGKARELLQQRKIEENLEAWIRQLRDQAYVEIKAS